MSTGTSQIESSARSVAPPPDQRMPALGEWYALDLCASLAQQAGGPVLVHTDDAAGGRWLTGWLDTVALHQESADRRLQAGAPPTAIWYRPAAAAGSGQARQLAQRLAPSGRLLVLGDGPLRRFAAAGAGPCPSQRQVEGWLRAAGLRVCARYGFQGPASVAWAAAARLCERVGRLDLADRCHFAMRRSYRASVYLRGLAAQYLLVAQL